MTKSNLYDMYNSDKEFVSSYHGNTNWSVQQCVDDSWNNIKDTEIHTYDFGYIAVNTNDVIPRLGGFFIRPEFRGSEFKDKFFKELNTLFSGPFITAVHSSNDKAIDFLCKIGRITMTNEHTTYIIFNEGN